MPISCQVRDRCGFRVLTVDAPDGVVLSWEDLQLLKNAHLGPDAFAVEVFPPFLDEVNEINRRWLWELPDSIASLLPNLNARRT